MQKYFGVEIKISLLFHYDFMLYEKMFQTFIAQYNMTLITSYIFYMTLAIMAHGNLRNNYNSKSYYKLTDLFPIDEWSRIVNITTLFFSISITTV